MMQDGDTAPTDEARHAVKRMTKAGNVISAHLLYHAENRGRDAA